MTEDAKKLPKSAGPQNPISAKAIFSLLAINLGNQVVGLGLQVVVARQFGASVNLDAYLAGLAIPQYIVLILNTGVNASLLPAYYEKTTGDRDVFLANLTLALAILCVPIAILGFIFSPEIFCVLFSELPLDTIAMGTVICRYGFLAVITSVLINVLGSIHFIHQKFSYQAAVPALGQVVNLVLLFSFSRYGIYALLMAFLGSQLLQVLLLVPILQRLTFQPSIGKMFSPNVLAFLGVIVPMMLSTMVIKGTGVWDRYLSGVVANSSPGAISHVDYASKIITALAALSISALPTLIYPSISAAAAEKDHRKFITIVNEGLFFTFFITAPVLCIGYFVSLDAVQVLLQRGHFTTHDSAEVAAVLRVYLFSIVMRGLAGVAGNALYALKLIRWVAIVGVFETLLYVGYSYFLTRKLGVIGVPLGVTISFSVSVLWTLVLIRRKANDGEARLLSNYNEYLKVIGISLLTAIFAWAVGRLTAGGVTGVLVPITTGCVFYLALGYWGNIGLAKNAVRQMRIVLGKTS